MYDPENYRVGIVTNSLTLGKKHRDLIYMKINSETTKMYLFVILMAITSLVIVSYVIYRVVIKYRVSDT